MPYVLRRSPKEEEMEDKFWNMVSSECGIYEVAVKFCLG